MAEDMLQTGRRIRTEVLGAERVRTALDEADDFNRDFQELVTEYCWGACWSRDGLERKQRSLLNLGMLAGASRWPEFGLHFRSAFTNGMTLKELKDTLYQITIYCGVPAGIEAHRVANGVLKDMREKGELGAE